MYRKEWIATILAICLYLLAVKFCKQPEPINDIIHRKATIRLMKKHGVDILMVKWDDSVWITRDGKMIKVK